MAYKLISTEEMYLLLDNCVSYFLNKLKSEPVARHLLAGVDEIYNMLEMNPFIYRESQDPFLKALHYREAKIPKMDYLIICDMLPPLSKLEVGASCPGLLLQPDSAGYPRGVPRFLF